VTNTVHFISALVICSVAAYLIGSYVRQPVPTPDDTIKPVASSSSYYGEPYVPFADEKCPFGDAPDTQTCITQLAESTLAEANALANKLIQASPDKNANHFIVGYYTDLHTSVKAAQRTMMNYVDAYCSLDGMLSYGGTGMASDIQACRYYFVKQYLDTLNALDAALNANKDLSNTAASAEQAGIINPYTLDIQFRYQDKSP
jgi:hypothetical protein